MYNSSMAECFPEKLRWCSIEHDILWIKCYVFRLDVTLTFTFNEFRCMMCLPVSAGDKGRDAPPQIGTIGKAGKPGFPGEKGDSGLPGLPGLDGKYVGAFKSHRSFNSF